MAFNAFKAHEPNIVIIFYEEGGSFAKYLLYHKIKGKMREWQTIIRIGTKPYEYADYLIYPTYKTPRAKMEENFRAKLRSLLAT